MVCRSASEPEEVDEVWTTTGDAEALDSCTSPVTSLNLAVTSLMVLAFSSATWRSRASIRESRRSSRTSCCLARCADSTLSTAADTASVSGSSMVDLGSVLPPHRGLSLYQVRRTSTVTLAAPAVPGDGVSVLQLRVDDGKWLDCRFFFPFCLWLGRSAFLPAAVSTNEDSSFFSSSLNRSVLIGWKEGGGTPQGDKKGAEGRHNRV